VVLKVPRPGDGLWAMEEALQCRAAGAVVTELMGDESRAVRKSSSGMKPRSG
jgi:hypothetical protein